MYCRMYYSLPAGLPLIQALAYALRFDGSTVKRLTTCEHRMLGECCVHQPAHAEDVLSAGAKAAAARASSTANNPTSSSGYTTSSMYGGSGYGSSSAEARQPLNQQEYGGSKVGSTNYRGMNLDINEDRHHASGHGPQDSLLGDERPAAKSSFAGFEDVATSGDFAS